MTATINPQYATSWWGIGFSNEVRTGQVVPVKILEQDLVLWRDSRGTLHCHSAVCPHLGANIGYGGEIVDDCLKCPFHGYRYDTEGRGCSRRGESSTTPERLALQRYIVEEHFGTIFVWNGRGQPDHAFPVEAILPAGLKSESDTTTFHCAYYLPFPARQFAENVADANHLAGAHRSCDWGDVELIEESPWFLKQRMHVSNPVRVFSKDWFREHRRIGQLGYAAVTTENGITFTTFGGGLNLVEFAEFQRTGDRDRLLDKALTFVASATGIATFTPITATRYWHGVTFVAPKVRVRVPLPTWAIERAMNRVMRWRSWGPIVQDASVMYYRRDPENPVYGRLDRGLVRYRRFCDSRLEDRSLWAGDSCHSYGLRAGIRWDEAPSSNGRTEQPVTQ